jgi:hypothetical protein
MSRFSKQELLDYINVQTVNSMATLANSQLPSGEGLDMNGLRAGIVGLMTFTTQSLGEAFRHLTNVSNAEGVMYQLGGDNPAGQFSITLLQEGEAGGIAVPDGSGGTIETGYKLIPIMTGSSTGGFLSPSDPFDGESEITAGDIPNTVKVTHDGQLNISASCLPEPTQNTNRQIEVDIVLYDPQGVPLRVLGFRTSVNNASNGRASSATVPSVNIQDTATIPPGSNIGLCIRKAVGEPAIVVTMLRSFLLLTFLGLAKT